MNEKFGQLSRDDILNELSQRDSLEIKIGRFSNLIKENHLKFASYDITPSIVAVSSKTGMLEKVYSYKSTVTNSYYIYVKPKDTVLIVSNELITVPNHIAGYVTSRVSNVADGFGHISTSIDPTWNGALLIALSNPSNRAIKIDVGISTSVRSNGQIDFIHTPQTLATVTFHYLNKPYKDSPIEYKNMRSDLLRKIRYNNKKGFKAFFRKVFYRKRKHFTDHFFEYITAHDSELSTDYGWQEFIDEFSIVIEKKRNIEANQLEKKCACDFIIKENCINRLKHFIINHKVGIGVLIVFILLILTIIGVIDQKTLDTIFWWSDKFKLH